MPEILPVILLVIAAAAVSYLLGSINSAVIFNKIFNNEDVRTKGSGNAGMTNAFRAGGKKVGILTMVGDLAKAFISVLLGKLLFFPLIASLAPESVSSVFHPVLGAFFCGFFCFIGHIFPVFFGFKGGKGVITAVGTVIMIDWRLFLLTFGLFLIVLAISKIVSLSSIFGAVMLPVATYIVYPFYHTANAGFQYGFLNLRLLETFFAGLIGIIIIVKHRSNIARLIKGEESKIGKRKA